MGDLFEVHSYKKRFDANKVTIKENGSYPYVVRTALNNGIRGYIDEDTKYLNEGNTISFGQDTATMFYQERPYFTGDKIKILKPKDNEFNKNNAQFLLAIMSKSFSSYSWGTTSFSVKKIENQGLVLPIKNGAVDFDFMESFIAELEAQRIFELEAYLKTTGLQDYQLNEQERKALQDLQIDDLTWEEFLIEDILNWQMGISEINPLHIDALKVTNDKNYPFYGQSTKDNGIIEYLSLDSDVLNNKEAKSTLLIHSNNQNVVYLETPFYLKDGHGATSVLQSEDLNKYTAFFISSSISKVIKEKFSYQNKATKIALKSTLITLPTKDNQPDFDYMQTLISAVQKLVIKEVVQYSERKMQAYDEMLG